MKKIISFVMLFCFVISPMYVYPQEILYQDIFEMQQEKHEGPIARFIKANPLLSAIVLIIPIIFLSYKWHEAEGLNAELTRCNAECAQREQSLTQELSTMQTKLEEREEFIKTTFKEVNDKLHLLKFMRSSGSNK